MSKYFALAMSLIPLGVLPALGAQDTPAAQKNDDGVSQSSDAAEQEQLVRQHAEMVSRIKGLWQQGEDLKAYVGLQELLALYHRILPKSKFPAGHQHFVRCYRDLCRVTDQLGEYDALLKYSQDGLAMCQMLYAKEKYPHGHLETVNMLANLGHAWLRQHQPVRARGCLLKSLEMNDNLCKHTSNSLGALTVIDLHLSVAATFAQEGDDLQALHYANLAVDSCRSLPEKDQYLKRLRLLARCLLEQGRALVGVGDYSTATDSLNQTLDARLRVFHAERSPAARLALIDAHIDLGILLRHKSDLPNAKWHLRRAEDELRQTKKNNVDTKVQSQMCSLELLWLSRVDGRHADSLRHAELVREAMVTDPPDRNVISCALEGPELQQGITYHLLGDSRGAERHFLAAYSIAKARFEASARPTTEYVLINDSLADIYLASGHYHRAHSHYMDALSLARQVFPCEKFGDGHRLFAAVLQDAATQLWLLGETESSAALYRESMLMTERLYPVAEYPLGHRQLMAAYSAWGNVLEREGDIEGAAVYFSRAHQIAVAQFPEAEYPHGHDELAAVWRDLGRLQRDQGRFDIATAYFDRALASYEQRYSRVFPDGHLLVALTLSELGRTSCDAGDFPRAERLHNKSLAMRRKLFAVSDYPKGHPSLATALRDVGHVFQASARYDKAFHSFQQSARMEQTVAESFVGGGSEALLLNLAARKFQSMDCLLDAWCQSTRPAAEAYQNVWWRRGFVPRLLAERYRALRQFNGPGSLADREGYLDLRREISRALLVSASRDDQNDSTRLSAVRRLNIRKEELEARLMPQLKFGDGPTTTRERTPQELAKRLPAGTALVDFVRYRARVAQPTSVAHSNTDTSQLLAFVVARDQPIVCVRLGDAARVEELAEQWHQAVRDGRDFNAAHELRQLVWDPVTQNFPDDTRTVYLALDGSLSLIPWNALPLPHGSKLLIEEYEIASVPHGLFLLQSLASPSTQDAKVGKILAVGNLDFGRRSVQHVGRLQGLKQVTWQPLAGSGEELRKLRAAAGERECVMLTGTNATRETVIKQLPMCRWAHFATHGFFVDQSLRQSLRLTAGLEDEGELIRNQSRMSVLRRSPFVRSGLALSGANLVEEVGGGQVALEATGILTAETITTVDCSGLDLVVLSACQSGRGDVVHGDGVFGIQMAFHAAGARNVIASLWTIDDQATAELMSIFYHLLWTEKQNPLTALRNAQLQMLHRSRSQNHQSRGPDLADTVPLPKVQREPNVSTTADIRRWAAFSLSGPGF